MDLFTKVVLAIILSAVLVLLYGLKKSIIIEKKILSLEDKMLKLEEKILKIDEKIEKLIEKKE